jgi:hypothetical protein
MPKPERRDPTKEKYWRRILAQWQRTGWTGRAFCAHHGLSEASFYAWRREIARRDLQPPPPAQHLRPPAATPALPAFVQITPAPQTLPSAIEIVLGPERCLRVRPGFDAALLRQLLQVLEEPAC